MKIQIKVNKFNIFVYKWSENHGGMLLQTEARAYF